MPIRLRARLRKNRRRLPGCRQIRTGLQTSALCPPSARRTLLRASARIERRIIALVFQIVIPKHIRWHDTGPSPAKHHEHSQSQTSQPRPAQAIHSDGDPQHQCARHSRRCASCLVPPPPHCTRGGGGLALLLGLAGRIGAWSESGRVVSLRCLELATVTSPHELATLQSMDANLAREKIDRQQWLLTHRQRANLDAVKAAQAHRKRPRARRPRLTHEASARAALRRPAAARRHRARDCRRSGADTGG